MWLGWIRLQPWTFSFLKNIAPNFSFLTLKWARLAGIIRSCWISLFVCLAEPTRVLIFDVHLNAALFIIWLSSKRGHTELLSLSAACVLAQITDSTQISKISCVDVAWMECGEMHLAAISALRRRHARWVWQTTFEKTGGNFKCV